ncbi:hypothetical protein TNCV_3184761 [Trichonephila clavipes]|nr:hypothetical protein TNCV_3184761 [Trichonephila clavipes]
MACDAEDCGFQMLNDDEIVTSAQEESDPVGDERAEDEDNNETAHSHQGSQRLANQRLHLGRDEVSDWLDAQHSTLAALV